MTDQECRCCPRGPGRRALIKGGIGLGVGLALGPELALALAEYAARLEAEVLAKAERLEELGPDSYLRQWKS